MAAVAPSLATFTTCPATAPPLPPVPVPVPVVPVPPGPDTTYTVTYRKAKAPRHEGILVEGETVEVRKEGTTFDVVPTGKS